MRLRIYEGNRKEKKVQALLHVWDLTRLPVGLSDEAGEAALRMDMRMARVSSTQADAAVKDILANDLYRLLHAHGQKPRQSSAAFCIRGSLYFVPVLESLVSLNSSAHMTMFFCTLLFGDECSSTFACLRAFTLPWAVRSYFPFHFFSLSLSVLECAYHFFEQMCS